MREKIPQIKNKGLCGPCKRSRFEIYEHIVPTRNFKSFTTKRTYEIRPGNLNCSSKNVVYLMSCNICYKQFNRSSEEFRARFNHCKCVHRNYSKNYRKQVKQGSFHANFADDAHSGEGDWEVRLTDQSDSPEDLWK